MPRCTICDETKQSVDNLNLNYVCKLYAYPNLNRSHVQKQVEDISQLFEDVFSTIKPYLKSTENQQSYDLHLKKVTDAVIKPFKSTLLTEYLRMRAIERREKYIKQEIMLLVIVLKTFYIKVESLKRIIQYYVFLLNLVERLKTFLQLDYLTQMTENHSWKGMMQFFEL